MLVSVSVCPIVGAYTMDWDGDEFYYWNHADPSAHQMYSAETQMGLGGDQYGDYHNGITLTGGVSTQFRIVLESPTTDPTERVQIHWMAFIWKNFMHMQKEAGGYPPIHMRP